MSVWWSGLSARERLLFAVAGLIVTLAAVWQWVLAPSLAANRAARSGYEAMVRDAANLDQALAARRLARISQGATGAARVLDAEEFKGGVGLAASAKGISISRMQSGQGGELGLVFEQVDPRLLFVFLDDVETRLGGEVQRLTIEQAGDGLVRASFELTVRKQ